MPSRKRSSVVSWRIWQSLVEAAGVGWGNAMAEIELIVQADDMGMCHAVNEGIVRAFTDGIVTQAAVMAPCPWFDEAATLARAHVIPVGLHCTLTCEWDHLRWRPLSGGASLVGDDGTMHRTVEDARARLDAQEAFAELRAQADRVTAAGLQLVCCDNHMGPVCRVAYQRLCDDLRIPFLYPVIEAHVPFTSAAMLSPHEGKAYADKKAWLLNHIARLEAGLHYLCTHPAVPGPSSVRSPARMRATSIGPSASAGAISTC
jgi:chitin disaccharide deacetylase